jgi:hypothetical protein
MPKRSSEKRTESSRIVFLHAEFQPDGNPRDNIGPMMELWLEAQNHAIRIAGERLDREQREWATLQDGIDKLLPLIASYLNGQSFDAWKGVVRQLIRESVPNFHLLPDWTTQRMTSEANGRATAGEIQNAILDDIVSALKRLAPDSPC